MKEATAAGPKHGVFYRVLSEFRHFGTYPFNMRILLMTNMLYAFVLPVVELFVGTYIMRNSSELAYVVGYQLAVYTGIPITFLINGFLMRRIRISHLYSFGMLLSGVSMAVMMSLTCRPAFWAQEPSATYSTTAPAGMPYRWACSSTAFTWMPR